MSQEDDGQILIGSWKDLIANFSELTGHWAFRGQADAGWALDSTLRRRLALAKINQDLWPEQEARVLRIFKRKANLFLDHIPDDDDSFRWLALMQHHGAPTRLLDFTWSPYVAAFFALENATRDAAIWAIRPRALAAEISLVINGRRQKKDPEDIGPWNRGNYEKYFLQNEHSFVIYGEPQQMNQRLTAQSGTFVVPGTLADPVDKILMKLYEPNQAWKKLVLRTEKLRSAVMYELYSMNITNYTLFPGLDGLARSLSYELEYSWRIDPVTKEPKDMFDFSPNLLRPKDTRSV